MSPKYRVEYRHNNSGGSWWLKDEDWKSLEDAGWWVEWGGMDFCHYLVFEPHTAPDTCESEDVCPGHQRYDSYDEARAGERFIGAIATDACLTVEAADREGAESMAVAAWEGALRGRFSASDPGCSCGGPHYFRAREESGA